MGEWVVGVLGVLDERAFAGMRGWSECFFFFRDQRLLPRMCIGSLLVPLAYHGRSPRVFGRSPLQVSTAR